MAAIISIPATRLTLPKVKRGKAAGLSMPTMPTIRPSISEMRLLVTEPLPTMTAQERPRQTSQKYSNELKRMAMRASSGRRRRGRWCR